MEWKTPRTSGTFSRTFHPVCSFPLPFALFQRFLINSPHIGRLSATINRPGDLPWDMGQDYGALGRGQVDGDCRYGGERTYFGSSALLVNTVRYRSSREILATNPREFTGAGLP